MRWPAGGPAGGARRLTPHITRERLIGLAGVTGFVLASIALIARYGLFIHADTLFLWVLLGLLALAMTDLDRLRPQLLLDWLPIGLLLILYDYSRQISLRLGIRTHEALQIKFDEWLFGKPLLTVRLQHLLHQTKAVRVWEYPMFAVYMTHFFLPLIVAAMLWRFAYPRFRRFRAGLVALFTAGFITYVVFPADPPWLVSQQLHQLPTIYRTVFEVWGHIGLRVAGSIIDRGDELGNQVAAIPSMHAATSMFICLFFWGGARRWLRALLATYVLAMAFTLVYSGEHYVFDVLVGWLYAVATVFGVSALERLRSRVASSGGAGAQASLAGHRTDVEPAVLLREQD